MPPHRGHLQVGCCNSLGSIVYGTAGQVQQSAAGHWKCFQCACNSSMRGTKIYVPRLPGLPNGFSYLPNRFGLQYEENAGDMSLRLPFLRLLMQHLNCSVFAPSYRGYGLSKGSPNEAGLKLDAQAALDWLQASKDVSQGQIALFGRSLGGAVAIYLAASNPQAVKAVMIENTFTSIEEVMPLLRPFLGPGRPFNFLIRNKWRSGQQMHKLRQLPVLLLSSLQDEMLPPEQMRQLYNSISSSGNATWAEFPQAGHMDAYETQPLVEGQTTATGADKETFGTGTAAQSEAGKKGGAISAGRPEEERKAAGQKAADTRAERYGEQRHT
eukprot:jgi/Astpho2/1904/Aster-00423